MCRQRDDQETDVSPTGSRGGRALLVQLTPCDSRPRRHMPEGDRATRDPSSQLGPVPLFQSLLSAPQMRGLPHSVRNKQPCFLLPWALQRQLPPHTHPSVSPSSSWSHQCGNWEEGRLQVRKRTAGTHCCSCQRGQLSVTSHTKMNSSWTGALCKPGRKRSCVGKAHLHASREEIIEGHEAHLAT